MKAPLRWAVRLSLLGIAAVALPGGSSCDGNLGSVSTGPVSFRISVAPNFAVADGASDSPAASEDGNLVAFASRATNMAPSEPGFKEIFLRDRTAQTVRNVSHLSSLADKSSRSDCGHPAIDRFGEYVIFESRSDLRSLVPDALTGVQPVNNLFRWAAVNDTVSDVVPTPLGPTYVWPDGECVNPSLSADGLTLVYESTARNIQTSPAVTFTAPSPRRHIYATNLNTGITRLVSHALGDPTAEADNESDKPMVSDDGFWIVFRSRAQNLAAGATNSKWKIYKAALDDSSLELVSRQDGLAGTEADLDCHSPSISEGGLIVAFASQGGNLVSGVPPGSTGWPLVVRDYTDALNPVNRVVARDHFLGVFTAQGDRNRLSKDGRWIAYTGLRPDETDIEVKVGDTLNGGSRGVSRGFVTAFAVIDDLFAHATISGDGRWVFWKTGYAQQVLNDTNDLSDVFGYGPLR